MRRELHHYIKGKTKKKSTTSAQRNMDKLIYLMTPITIVIFVPQLAKIYTEQNAAGLSLVSWTGMLIGSVFWLLYGFVHKEKPMIVVNVAIGIIQFLIVVGILMYQ